MSPVFVTPAIFISYSQPDRGFVDRLVKELVLNGNDVWLDQWEIKVGDSLLQKIEEGITSASYLGVVLSKASVGSSWVRVELNAAMNRELSSGKVFVIPILAEDCEIPLFLKDKKYADFRKDFQEGLKELLSRLEPPDIGTHGRVKEEGYYIDFAIDWGVLGEERLCRIIGFLHGPKMPYSVLCDIDIRPDDALNRRFGQFEEAGFPWAWPVMLMTLLEELTGQADPRILIQGDEEVLRGYKIVDPKLGRTLEVHVRARRLGPDPDRDQLYDWGTLVRNVATYHKGRIRATVPKARWMEWFDWTRQNPLVATPRRASVDQ